MLISILACSLGFHAINAVLLRKSPFKKSNQCGTEPVGIAFWPPCCAYIVAENVVTDRQTDGMTAVCVELTIRGRKRRCACAFVGACAMIASFPGLLPPPCAMRARNLMRGWKNGGRRPGQISHVIRDSSDVNVPFI